MTARFRASYTGIGRMLRSEPMLAAMLARAEQVKARAEAIAPVDTGEYARSFSVEGTRAGGAHHDRAVAAVRSDDPAAFAIEVGTEDTPAHRTLRKALDAARD